MLPIGTTLQLRNVPVVTITLIALNTIIYIFDCLYVQYYYDIPIVEYFISLFSVFFHADFFHLFGNMLFLWIFGSHLEDKIGSKRFLFYYFICEIGASIFHLVADGSPAIGASGAISGVMGIYLYRCHYSKIKTIVPVLFWYLKVHINAVWLLLFWMARDIYDGFYADDNVAYWAHIGGYSTGILIGLINNYWSQSKVEHLYERATDSINNRWGLADAEKDLLETLRMEPDNPDINLQLARCYAMKDGKIEKSKKHYLASARAYYLKNDTKSKAGEVFLEYMHRYREPVDPDIHLKYANTLSNVYDYYGASNILKPLIDSIDLKGNIGERIFLDFIDCTLKAESYEAAKNAYDQFRKTFPDSLLITKAKSLVLSYKPKEKEKIQIEEFTSPNRFAGLMENINDLTSDWIFWFIALLLLNIFSMAIDFSGLILFFLFLLLALLITFLIRNCSSFIGSIFEGGGSKSEAEGLRQYHINKFMDKAKVCEREENYEDAIEYLRAVLEEDKSGENHVAVRYNIARLYQKLNQPQKAIDEYKTVMKITPKDHPFKRDSYDSIKKLSQQTQSLVLNYN